MSNVEFYKNIFESTLKSQIWAKEINGKFYPAIGSDIFDGSNYMLPEIQFQSHHEAVECAKKIQMKNLKDIACSIVGEGNEYRGLIAESTKTGN